MNACLLAPLLGVLLQVATLRFAWLSDTHVGSETGALDLAAAVAELNACQDLDFVILSAVPVNTITPVDARHLLATTFDGEVVLLSWAAE